MSNSTIFALLIWKNYEIVKYHNQGKRVEAILSHTIYISNPIVVALTSRFNLASVLSGESSQVDVQDGEWIAERGDERII
jgi:hypothetical protein